jgi:hypothetical protein
MSEEAIIQPMPAGTLPGTLRKRLTVPEGRLALLVDGGEVVGQHGPGEHQLGNWPRPAPDALLLPQMPFGLRPRIQRLRSGDRQPFDLVWPLTVQVKDPARFYADCLAQAPWSEPASDLSIALADLEDTLAGLLWEVAQKDAIQYSLDDLQAEGQVQSSLGRSMRATLTSALDDVGLKLVGSQRPQPRTLDQEREALGTMNQAARAARDTRFEALFEKLEDKEMLAHRLQEWAAERGQSPPDGALVDLLWQVVDQSPEEAAIRAQQAAELMERQVASLRMTLQSERTENERRFRQLVARLEKTEKAAVKAQAVVVDPVHFWKQLLFALRVVGLTLTLLAGLTAILAPQLSQEYAQLQGGAAVMTVALAVLTLLSELWLRGRMRQVRRLAAEQKRSASRANLKRRRQADALVRARVEAGLKQVAANLEAAWKKGYSAGGEARDLAVDLREVARKVARFEEQEVRAANYQAGRYLAQDRVPDEQLAAVLDLDEDLLARSRSLAQATETLFEQVNDGQVEPARAALREVENGLNALRNRFTERGAYLMDPS